MVNNTKYTLKSSQAISHVRCL